MHPGWVARLMWLLLASLASLLADDVVRGNVVFPVQHRFKGREWSLGARKAHDVRRHGRFLFDVDLELGGNGLPSKTGLYFAKIGLGSPSKDYYVQVDTGSQILWVNGVGCSQCPTKSDLGIELTLYDAKSSSTSSSVTCDQAFCTSLDGGQAPGCTANSPCHFSVGYGDGSSSSGSFLKDNINLEQVTGNFQTAPASGSVIFGCATTASGLLASSPDALDGILGLGPANSSMISQLASAGKVKKMFAHCLDNVRGGGIFAIGQVVEPKVNTTPLLPYQAYYNVELNQIAVGGDLINVPSDTFEIGFRKGTIIDSGTTLAYLPEVVYNPLVNKITAAQSGLKLFTSEDQFTCFQYSGNVDDGFPMVTFSFESSLSLKVYPHDYLFQLSNGAWCLGWQNNGPVWEGGSGMTVLGDLVLSNRLVVYDLEKHAIGWTEYNCSSSIELAVDSGAVYSVGAQNLSSASTPVLGRMSTILLLPIAMLHYSLY